MPGVFRSQRRRSSPRSHETNGWNSGTAYFPHMDWHRTRAMPLPIIFVLWSGSVLPRFTGIALHRSLYALGSRRHSRLKAACTNYPCLRGLRWTLRDLFNSVGGSFASPGSYTSMWFGSESYHPHLLHPVLSRNWVGVGVIALDRFLG